MSLSNPMLTISTDFVSVFEYMLTLLIFTKIGVFILSILSFIHPLPSTWHPQKSSKETSASKAIFSKYSIDLSLESILYMLCNTWFSLSHFTESFISSSL